MTERASNWGRNGAYFQSPCTARHHLNRNGPEGRTKTRDPAGGNRRVGWGPDLSIVVVAGKDDLPGRREPHRNTRRKSDVFFSSPLAFEPMNNQLAEQVNIFYYFLLLLCYAFVYFFYSSFLLRSYFNRSRTGLPQTGKKTAALAPAEIPMKREQCRPAGRHFFDNFLLHFHTSVYVFSVKCVILTTLCWDGRPKIFW